MKNFTYLSRTVLAGLLVALLSISAQAQTHFDEISGNSTSDTWTLFMIDVQIDTETADEGDELGIFDGNTLVGVYEFTGDEFDGAGNTDNPVIAFSLLSNGPGYSEGNVVSFKFWDDSEGKEYTGLFQASDVYHWVNDTQRYIGENSDGYPIFPSEDNEYSYISLDFTSGGTVQGTVTLDGCDGNVEDVYLEVTAGGISLGTGYPNSSGNYEINGVQTGNSPYTITATLDNYDSAFGTFDFASDPATVNLTLTAHTGNIGGTVSNEATSNPINDGGLTVELYDADGNLIDTYEDNNNNGNYAFNVCVGEYYMVYSHNDYINATGENFTLANGDNLDIDFALTPLPGSLSGKVIDSETSNPVPNAVVTAVDENVTPPETLFTVVTNASGDYFVSEVPSGTWEIVATSGNHNEGSVAVTIAPNQLTEAADIELTPLPGILEGTVREEGTSELMDNVNVKIHIPGQSNPTTITDYTGYYQITDVPVGTYDVTFTKSGYETHTEEDVTIVSLTATTVSPYLSKVAGSLLVRTTNINNGQATVTIGSEYEATYYNNSNTYGDGYLFPALPPGTYDVLVEHDGFHSYLIEDVEVTSDNQTVEIITLTPYHWGSLSGNTFKPVWTLFLQTVTIDGNPVEAGDEIAVYDGIKLVGVYHVGGQLSAGNATNQDLTAYSELNDGSTGYTDGNNYSFKLYDVSEGEEILAPIITLDEHNDNFAYEGSVFPAGDSPYSFVKLQFLGEETVSLELEQGYQIISSRVMAENMDFEELLDGSGIRPNLDFFKDEAGYSYFETGTGWTNLIGDWENTEGYLVKMSGNATFTMTGTPVDPQMDIPLNNGYSFISYLSDEPMDAATAFSSLNNNLIFVRDTEGKQYWKIGGNWVNNIGNLEPGEGYFVKTTAATTFNYPAAKSGSAMTGDSEPQYFKFSGGDATSPVYTVYVESDQLQTGDEIAAFDGDIMVGASVVENPSDYEENALSLFSVVDNGQGYKAGNQITFKVWSQEKNEVYTNIEVEYLNPHGDAHTTNIFPEEDGAYSIIKTSLNELDVPELDSETAMNVYPNPATDHLNINTEEDITEIRVLNTSGQVMLQKEINSNNYSLNVGNLDAGIYILQATFKNRQSSLRFAVK